MVSHQTKQNEQLDSASDFSESQDTDQEFWDELNINPDIDIYMTNDSQEYSIYRRQAKCVTLGMDLINSLAKSELTNRPKSRIQTLYSPKIPENKLPDPEMTALENCRLAHGIELKNLMIVSEKRYRNMANQKIAAAKHAIQEEQDRMKEKMSRLKEIMKRKDEQIRFMQQHITTQEAFIIGSRTEGVKVVNKFPGLRRGTKLEQILGQQALQLENDNKTKQINALDYVAKITKKNQEDQRDLISALKQQKDELDQWHQENLEKVTSVMQTNIDELEKANQDLQKEFEQYKENISNEMSVLEALKNQHCKLISDLQYELKNIKGVLSNPRMKHKLIRTISAIDVDTTPKKREKRITKSAVISPIKSYEDFRPMTGRSMGRSTGRSSQVQIEKSEISFDKNEPNKAMRQSWLNDNKKSLVISKRFFPTSSRA